MSHPEIILHADDTFSEATRTSLYGYINKDLEGKLDSYIKKHEKPNSPVRVELTVKHAKEKSFDGKLVLTDLVQSQSIRILIKLTSVHHR